MHAVAGILPEGVPAVLPGHRRRVVAGEKYPGIVPDAAETVEGILYLNLPEEALVRLDAFDLFTKHVQSACFSSRFYNGFCCHI